MDEAILLADRIIPLKPGTPATLGPEFSVPFNRPRDRGELNHNDDFIQLRAEVTEYLMAAGAERGADLERDISLPNIVPITQRDQKGEKLPAAYERASGGLNEERYLDFSQLKKVYPTPKGPLTVVDGFELKMKKGEFITLIGHSGCGKSTVLSMVAGLNPITEGAIVLDGTHVTQAGPDRAVVFQAPSLMPWLTAYENVALGVDKVYPDASQAKSGTSLNTTCRKSAWLTRCKKQPLTCPTA